MPIGALEFLGSTKLTVATPQTDLVTVAPRDLLAIIWQQTSSTNQPTLRFNGDTTAANYQSSWVNGTAAAPPVLSNIFTTAASAIRLSNLTVQEMAGLAIISNGAASAKTIKLLCFTLGSAVGTQSVHELGGGGAWFNTTDQITDIRMMGTGANLGVGSGFAVFGINL